MKKLSLLLMLGTVLNPWSANATDCVATPDCASLGLRWMPQNVPALLSNVLGIPAKPLARKKKLLNRNSPSCMAMAQ